MQRPVTTVIAREKCNGCGLCVRVCPARTLTLEEGKAAVTGSFSLGCGQCAAVCPVLAVRVAAPVNQPLALRTMALDDRWLPWGAADAGELIRLMRSRRSCRLYQQRPVPLDLLRDLVTIGTTAPSGTNSQRWGFTILPERESVMALGNHLATFYRKLNRLARNPLARLFSRVFMKDVLGQYYRDYLETVEEGLRQFEREGIDRLFHGAPAVILVSSRPGASCPSDDCHLATQNILLAAHALGLGTCLVGFTVEAMKADRRLQERIGIPSGERVYSAIALGWPAIRYQCPTGRLPIEPRIFSVTSSVEPVDRGG